jgi:AraC family transcriptional regulator, regulatory protein of adaptative response / methylated-DNA-[protein]-cysteine methyltransferase
MTTTMTLRRPLPETPLARTEDECWQALVDRDRRADGAFYYSVRTTGVYCRPSCAARLPRRENVRFHASPEEAERAGFRPCKRCRPNEASAHAAAVASACRLIAEAEEMPTLDDLATAAGLSRFHFHRVFKSVTGLTPRDYAAAERARRVRDGLKDARSVTEAIYDAGFNSSGRFYEASSSLLGMTPTRFRAGGEGTAIRFAVGQCSLGAILVAATAQGICAIALGDDPEALVKSLEDRFPKASLVGADASFETWVARVVGFVEAPHLGFDLPLDLRGTAFQQRVWRALTDIPPGTTTTYAELARRLGVPSAVRAVAGACARNPVAVAIPCHRVVRRDGDLAGYRWGIERKRALISREARS